MATSATSSVVQAWELGLRLRERREQLGLTATVVGKTTRIGGTNLSAIESGKRRLTAAKLTDLAGDYELSADELAELEASRARAEQREWYHDYQPSPRHRVDQSRRRSRGVLAYPAGSALLRRCRGWPEAGAS